MLFLSQAAARAGVVDGPVRIAPEAMDALEAARYGGNVRDLRNVITRAYLRAGASDDVRLEHLKAAMQRPLRFERRGDHATQLRVVAWALWKTRDRVQEAARLIGANRNTVAALRAELMARQGPGWSVKAVRLE